MKKKITAQDRRAHEAKELAILERLVQAALVLTTDEHAGNILEDAYGRLQRLNAVVQQGENNG